MNTDVYDSQKKHLKDIGLKPDLSSICVKSPTDVRHSYQLWIVEDSKKRKCIFQVTRAVSDFLSLHSGAHGRRYCLLLLEIKMQAEVQVLNTPIIKVEP